MSEITETEIKSMTKEQNYMRGYRDGKSDVLDKIRAEINKLTVYYTTKDKGINLISQNAVNRIFDKYKKTEDKE